MYEDLREAIWKRTAGGFKQRESRDKIAKLIVSVSIRVKGRIIFYKELTDSRELSLAIIIKRCFYRRSQLIC